jgi:hypothetical protein
MMSYTDFMEAVPLEDTLGNLHASPKRVGRFLLVGTRIQAGPSFAFAAGSTELLTDEQREIVKMILISLPIVHDPNDPEG